jgi:hypothetical protein
VEIEWPFMSVLWLDLDLESWMSFRVSSALPGKLGGWTGSLWLVPGATQLLG